MRRAACERGPFKTIGGNGSYIPIQRASLCDPVSLDGIVLGVVQVPASQSVSEKWRLSARCVGLEVGRLRFASFSASVLMTDMTR